MNEPSATVSEIVMATKVELLKRAFPLGDDAALMLLQAAGASYEIAFDAYLNAEDPDHPARYGTSTHTTGRLLAAQKIARQNALKAAGFA